MARKPKIRKTTEQLQAEVQAKRANDFEAVSLPADAAVLPSQDDIEVTRTGQKRGEQTVKADSARRLDAFEAIRPSMKSEKFAGCYDAARRFERDLMVRYGMHDHGRPVARVDCERNAFDRNDLMIIAGERIDRVMARMSSHEGRLLHELVVPSRPGEEWRVIVKRITGEWNANAQGAVVRSACVSLRDAYIRQDVASRRAA